MSNTICVSLSLPPLNNTLFLLDFPIVRVVISQGMIIPEKRSRKGLNPFWIFKGQPRCLLYIPLVGRNYKTSESKEIDPGKGIVPISRCGR